MVLRLALMSSDKWLSADSDGRFAMLLSLLEAKEKPVPVKSTIKGAAGRDAVAIERAGTVTRFSVDDRQAPGFAEWLAAELPSLVARFEKERT